MTRPSLQTLGILHVFHERLIVKHSNEILKKLLLNQHYKLLFLNSSREIQRGDEVAWYADGDTTVRSEYNASTAYAFGAISVPMLRILRILVGEFFEVG